LADIAFDLIEVGLVARRHDEMTCGCPSGVRRISRLSHRGFVQIALGRHGDGVGAAVGLGISAREYPVLTIELRKMLGLARC
jgi:hypothetical protein